MHRLISIFICIAVFPFVSNGQTAKPSQEQKSAVQAAADRYGIPYGIHGLAEVMKSFKYGMSMADAKRHLIATDRNDRFEVDSTSEKYIFYRHEERGEDPIYVAVLREKGEFYPEGSGFKHPFFRIVGAARVGTAGGAEVDIIVLEGLM